MSAVPGFDFMKDLLGSAGKMPAFGQWVAPTLDPDELDKRIAELKSVQYWLEQNAKMLAATIQALEVQRMTLATLKTMNLSLGELGQSLSAKPAAPARAPTPPAGAAKTRSAQPHKAAAAPAVDAMQWWGALTQQFADLAAATLKDGGQAAAPAAPAGSGARARRARPAKPAKNAAAAKPS